MGKIEFTVQGPFEIPILKRPGGRRVREDIRRAFWQKKRTNQLARRYGCYVFAWRAGRGTRPMYVGKATKSFQQECFSDRNLDIYNDAVSRRKKGTPVMFLLVAPSRRGKNNAKAVAELEKVLIHEAKWRNPALLNKRGVKEFQWDVKGVWVSKPGRPSRSSKKFVAMMHID